ncbi:hypothetical protein DFJ74DRAFT_694375 [Hyaloraphidium curvatum]|nr:hypothetical protein DFJ74DRAFT_694375 [Hyaloraphidium curvatum]
MQVLLMSVMLRLLDNPRPWNAHCSGNECDGKPSAASLCVHVLSAFCSHLRRRDPDPGTLEKLDRLDAATSALPKFLEAKAAADDKVRKEFLRFSYDFSNIADSCDRCGAESDTLLRCSGCKVTRYCGAACQRAAWKDHKDICRQWS